MSLSKGVPSFDVIPCENPIMRKCLMFLGTGKHMDLDWFLPLQANAVEGQDAFSTLNKDLT